MATSISNNKRERINPAPARVDIAEELIIEKAEWMLDNPDKVDWVEFVRGLSGASDGGEYKDVVASMPTREEIIENLRNGKKAD